MNNTDGLPKLPTAANWRKKGVRTRFFNKLDQKLCAMFAYEIAGQEVLSIRRDALNLPEKHLYLLKLSYVKAFYPPKEQRKGLFETVGKWLGGKDKDVRKIIHLISNPYFEISADSQSENENSGPNKLSPINFYRCISRAAMCGMDVVNRKNSWKLLGKRKLEESDHAQFNAAKGYYFYDWDQQVKTLASLYAIENEFGGPVEIEELTVCNDWLMDRMMVPLSYVQVFTENWTESEPQ